MRDDKNRAQQIRQQVCRTGTGTGGLDDGKPVLPGFDVYQPYQQFEQQDTYARANKRPGWCGMNFGYSFGVRSYKQAKRDKPYSR